MNYGTFRLHGVSRRGAAGNLALALAGILLLAGSQLAGAQEQDGERENLGIEEVRIRVDGLACPFCAFNIEKRLVQLEGVSGPDQINVSVADGFVSLDWSSDVSFDPDDANEQVRRSGFTPGQIELVASGRAELPGGERPGHGHLHLLTDAKQIVVIIAGDRPENAERFEALEAKVDDSEEPFGVRVEGSVRQDEDSWQLALQEWGSL